jgi:hypothetical protein
MFNRENDINYIGQGIGYTQGLGVSYEVDFDTFKDLVNKIFKNQKLERLKKSKSTNEDSNLSADEFAISKSKKPTTSKQTMNTDGTLPEED